jgi:hypothetical protein
MILRSTASGRLQCYRIQCMWGLFMRISSSLAKSQRRVLPSRSAQLLTIVLIISTVAAYIITFHGQGYGITGNWRILLSWAFAVNLVFAILVFLFAFHFGWIERFWRVFSLPMAAFLLPFVLVGCVRVHIAHITMQSAGFIYVMSLLSAALIVTWYAFANVQHASRTSLSLWVLLTTALIYVGITGWLMISTGVTGDEPHYLLLSYSLVKDRDFDLANNYNQRDYRAFYPYDIDPHTVSGTRGRAMLSHDVGLPILLVPGYALGGRIGATVELNIIAALLALGIYEAAIEVAASPTGAILAWGFFAFSAPLVIYESQIFPETAGVACALWAVILFSKFIKSGKSALLWWLAFLIALLPWLNMRFWIFVVALEFFIALYIIYHCKNWHECTANAAALTLPIGFTLLLFAWFDYVHFGTMLPNAGYLHEASTYFKFTHSKPISGALGLLFDRSVGVVPIAPVYLIAFAGLLPAFRKAPWLVGSLVAASLSYFLAMSFNEYWTGGWCPPARFSMGATALLTPAAALVVANRTQRWFLGVTGTWSFLVALVYTAFPRARYPVILDRAGFDLVLRKYLGSNFDVFFPSMIRSDQTDYFLAILWGISVAGCIWLLNRAETSTSPRTNQSALQ